MSGLSGRESWLGGDSGGGESVTGRCARCLRPAVKEQCKDCLGGVEWKHVERLRQFLTM